MSSSCRLNESLSAAACSVALLCSDSALSDLSILSLQNNIHLSVLIRLLFLENHEFDSIANFGQLFIMIIHQLATFRESKIS